VRIDIITIREALSGVGRQGLQHVFVPTQREDAHAISVADEPLCHESAVFPLDRLALTRAL
jgi:hypothetical protein